MTSMAVAWLPSGCQEDDQHERREQEPVRHEGGHGVRRDEAEQEVDGGQPGDGSRREPDADHRHIDVTRDVAGNIKTVAYAGNNQQAQIPLSSTSSITASTSGTTNSSIARLAA